VIYEAAVLAVDGSPGRQCNELMSYVSVNHTYTFGVPVMENVRQIGNKRDGHNWHFLGLRLPIWWALVRKKRLCKRGDKFSYSGMDWCNMATCTGEVLKCVPTTVTMLCKLSSILSWHSPPWWLKVDWLSCKILQPSA